MVPQSFCCSYTLMDNYYNQKDGVVDPQLTDCITPPYLVENLTCGPWWCPARATNRAYNEHCLQSHLSCGPWRFPARATNRAQGPPVPCSPPPLPPLEPLGYPTIELHLITPCSLSYSHLGSYFNHGDNLDLLEDMRSKNQLLHHFRLLETLRGDGIVSSKTYVMQWS